MRMKSLVIFSSAVLLTLAGSAQATITGISSDGCPATTCLPPFVAPIVAGKQMSVTVRGQYLDLSTGVEISGSGVHVSFGDRSGGSNTYIVVKFNVDSSASLGDRTVKIHYAIETSGPDVFKVTVIRGGKIDQIQQQVPFMNSSHLIAADSIPVNQTVTLVFTGSRIGNAVLAPIAAVKNVQALPGCSETRCAFQLEFTQSGNIDINLFDGTLGSTANSLLVTGTLFPFYYGGAKQVKVTGQAVSATPTIGHQLLAGGSAPSAGFIDVAPGLIKNLFRDNGNSITVQGVVFKQVDDHFCADNGVQTPPPNTPANFKDLTVDDLVWTVVNVGTATVPAAFDSQLLSNGAVLQTGNTPAGLATAATREFTFHRSNSTVRLFRFSAPNPSGCFIKPSAGPTLFFLDPPFTVKVDIGHATGETQTNQSNNVRGY